MASGSSSQASGDKMYLFDLVLKQYKKDVAIVNLLGCTMNTIKESVKDRDQINKELSKLPEDTIRGLAIKFNMEHCSEDGDLVKKLADIIRSIELDMKIKMDFIKSLF